MSDLQFLEKQYFGLNRSSITLRISIAIFFFTAYYWLENQEKSGDLYFFVGIAIMIISIILCFILHFETKVVKDSLILNGLWTARKVKINIYSIVNVNKVAYSKYLINRSVYNLHRKGVIRFYTRGNEAVELTDKDGLIYLIGSQKAEELKHVITKKINL